MKNNIGVISRRQAALTAGLGLFIMTLFVIFALSFVFQKLIIPEDSGITVRNILTNKMLFRTGICSYLIVIICDVLVAWALYILLKPVNKSLSLLTAWFRLVYSVVFAAALSNYLNIFQLLSGTGYLSELAPSQLHAQVMLSINAFNDTWAIGYIFFGLHILLLGVLIFKSGFIPKILGGLIFVAGLSYLIDYFGKFISPNYNLNISMIFGWGELLFMLWLLFKGWRIPDIERGV